MSFIPDRNSPSVKVYVLPTGYLHLPDRWIFQDGDLNVVHRSPDFSFLIVHPSGKKVLFDLGLRKDFENNPKVIQEDYPVLKLEVPKDAYELLETGPVKPKDIDAVILSHLHFDHTGDVTRFPEAKIIAGPGSKQVTSPGWPKFSGSPFTGSVIEHSKYEEFGLDQYKSISVTSQSLPCPFENTIDYFGDGSFYIFDAPGHMKGHQGGLMKTGENEWIATGGDCCHHFCFLNPENKRDISVDVGPNGQPGFHKDPEEARNSIVKARQLAAYDNVFFVLAHDSSVEGIIPIYPQEINGWKKKGYKEEAKKIGGIS